MTLFAAISRLLDRGGKGYGESGSEDGRECGDGGRLAGSGSGGIADRDAADRQYRARLPRHTLLPSQGVTAHIYEAIGVRLVWLEDGVTPPPRSTMRLRIVLLNSRAEQRMLSDTRSPRGVLGAAPLYTGHAYLFCGRIEELARAVARDSKPKLPLDVIFDRVLVDILGRALAHEVGHHLLPAQGHAERGIMHEQVDYTSPVAPTFTAAQGAAIRALLMARCHTAASGGAG